MALSLPFTSAQGFTSPNAYFKISAMTWNRGTMAAVLEIYKDASARFTPLEVIATETYLVNLPLGGTVASAYAALKLKPRFANAIDV